MSEKLSLIELFSGIGAQIQGIKDTGLFDVQSIGVSEIDTFAIISYAAIHCGLTPELLETYPVPTEQEMIADLERWNIGYCFEKKQPCIWSKMQGDLIRKCWVACKLSNNYGDIAKVETLPYADFWTYSFPCTDLSRAGTQKGMVKGETRSGLLYEVERLLETAVNEGNSPKYLLLENVKALVDKQFYYEFNEWVTRLDELGYNTYYDVLNAKDCGVPQNRERVFAVSIRKDIDTRSYMFPVPFDNGKALCAMLETTVDEKYLLSEVACKKFLSDNADSISIIQREHGYNKGNITSVCPTITTSSWEYNNALSKDGVLRRLTPKECWRFMGFPDTAVDSVRLVGISDARMYKQAGNSIVTNCIALLMEHLYKAQYDDSYVCKDETFKLTVAEKEPACCGIMCVIDDIYSSRKARIYTEYCPTLRAERAGLKVLQLAEMTGSE